MPSYHDLHITTADLPRTSIFDLPFGLAVICTRAAGWELWRNALGGGDGTLVASEYAEEGRGLCLDVAGVVVMDSLNKD